MKNSREYYDSIAISYNTQSKERLPYLNAIDDLVVEKMKNHSNLNYLDIGSGDGRRAIKITNKLNISKLSLLEDSEGMLKLLNDKKVILHNVSFFEFSSNDSYDLITCLWNVLGHFPSKNHRFEFFHKIENLLSEKGVLIFDVNNRYNISYYGFENVMNNLVNDRSNNEDTGWFSLRNENVATKVYIHNPFDINEYLKDTSLQLIDTLFVNYETGNLEKTFFEGQLFYIIGKNDGTETTC
ncbi:methyltransferase domain-containing protein [Gelidibacter japonicus]|uniref:methyltransferase domain-containing protein n=1 Tax=Gelidibacter japonicus TaxID=1962232 RepID=UPI003A8DA689